MNTRKLYRHRDDRIRGAGLAPNYYAYLKSDLWRTIRARVLKRDSSTCRICGDKATQVHHTNYTEAVLTGRSLVALFAICGPCHKFIEFNMDHSKAHLMKQVRKRIKLLAHLKGRVFIDPGRESRPCLACKRVKSLQALNDDQVCRRCLSR